MSYNSHHQMLYSGGRLTKTVFFIKFVGWKNVTRIQFYHMRYLIISHNDNNHIIKIKYSETNDCIQLTFKDPPKEIILQSIIKTVAIFSTGGKSSQRRIQTNKQTTWNRDI